MIEPGQVVLFRFPHTNQQEGKISTERLQRIKTHLAEWLGE